GEYPPNYQRADKVPSIALDVRVRWRPRMCRGSQPGLALWGARPPRLSSPRQRPTPPEWAQQGNEAAAARIGSFETTTPRRPDHPESDSTRPLGGRAGQWSATGFGHGYRRQLDSAQSRRSGPPLALRHSTTARRVGRVGQQRPGPVAHAGSCTGRTTLTLGP